ncbi:putative disease resistance RPP13-like protein 1 isoform X1 [Quercus robur]|uniref:putative disease resistance RPP13-like protein 1 isoform X1 n=1 Tax=Quercus robur TaxID=38942 RepID=UPI0021623A7C|nr:putative disease resistance RPP13-like protein 1 isoform X1 [Quercus robur]XP_050258072.1 putative disease resistance RPP13-like protein 1 isoform X1 [Quercus robur]XP_050258073.1 putative disease resistance RPP13-like protein 1 isoform X1 [Quercus robur]XP_050258074.1 putative disease resistance RPP13-like protein 1 isoform X1 [Quercus robur]XP_050258076.1 putative disease resistance RPP13-like protein 1 isoform X1 [Quercus robur]XP_050258078.1 putative disease resistance RPP13-like protei
MMNQVPSYSFCKFDKVKTIKHTLDKFVNEIDGLGLKIVNSNPKISLDNIDSPLDDSEVIGREYSVLTIWDLFNDDNDVFLEFKSRFDSLTIPSLKRCFAYCAIFPKDYKIKKDVLILHWMAQGFLELSKESMVMEDIGNKYFKILLDKSLLQNGKKDEYGNIINYRMHELVHDFVRSISNSKSSVSDNFSHVRSLFVGFDGQTTAQISFEGDGFTKRCMLILKNADFGNILSKFRGLRVLMFYGCNVRELPESIGVLIHLRLLHICETEIKKLPKSVTELYNLQTLRIELCFNLEELPEDLSNLINLRHICINRIAPKNVGRLTCLQTLPIFRVGPDEGYRIRELGALKNLRGEIEIRDLENVEDEEEAKSAKLKDKEIFKLELFWSYRTRSVDNNDKDERVLEGLQPHPNLKSLTIGFYKGKKFPSWVNGLSIYHNLIQIYLINCTECEEVPTLGHLPCLRVLQINGMKKVRSIGSEFYSYSEGSHRKTTTLFPALRILKLQNMYELEEWKDAKELITACQVLVFPCLEELTIDSCDKLRYFPDSLNTCDSLHKLVLEGFEDLSYFPGVRSLIGHLEIRSCSIEELTGGLQFCTSLQYLKIEDCPNLESILDSLLHLINLNHLHITDCPNLEERYAEWFQISQIPNIKINGKYIKGGEDSGDSEDSDDTVYYAVWLHKKEMRHWVEAGLVDFCLHIWVGRSVLLVEAKIKFLINF